MLYDITIHARNSRVACLRIASRLTKSIPDSSDILHQTREEIDCQKEENSKIGKNDGDEKFERMNKSQKRNWKI
jgi:hypothetical protein